MRFIAEGPDLPGDLLDARDEGQVIFFCGAGVSRAEAGGPSFRELADRVVTELGSSQTSPARQLLALSDKIAPVPGVGGIPSADRIFALLEQEFPVADVRGAVARSLRPKPDAGLGPHQSLINLSRAPDGAVRLVTTNFDRVFEQADPSLEPIIPPALPDPARPGSLNGIIHLHGKVSLDYKRSEGPEFVLSSADFGRAYLADGWATTFMRALMDRYRIVFVGYSADDPPMQYLLEALQAKVGSGRLYALQEGDASYASGLWRHKGVTAIPFDGFSTLWRTLAAWAERATDPERWRKMIATMAVTGPRELLPYQRGQVAHLVSSPIGAGIFSEHEPAPPAEWLCVFDANVRYDRCRPVAWRDPEPDHFNPFESYGLDGETPPLRDEDRPEPITPPPGSWSAFESVASESPAGRPVSPSLRGPASRLPPRLSVRLWRLARWFGRVVSDPVALWWASGEKALHSDLVFFARDALLRGEVPSDIRTAWRLLLVSLDEQSQYERDRFELRRVIKAEGWSRLNILELVEVERPRLTTKRPMTSPISGQLGQLRYIDATVLYPGRDSNLKVPADYLMDYVDGTHRNLIIATRLEEEVGSFAFTNLRPLNAFKREPNEFNTRSPDLSSLIAHLAALVRHLLETAPDLAIAQVRNWRNEQGIPFRNLRVWAASEARLTNPKEAALILLSLEGGVWDGRLERDFLTAIKARWSELPRGSRKRIEAITLAGPQPWRDADAVEFEPYRIRAVLGRLFWMEREGIKVSFDLPKKLDRLKRQLPTWNAQDAAEQLDRSPSRGGWVATDKSHALLLDVPLDNLLLEAEAARGRGRDFLTETRPFRGLVETRPVRALAALRQAADRGETWNWAWNDLFWSEARGSDKRRFRCLLARRIAELPDAILSTNLQAAAQWFTSHSRPIWEDDRDLYLATWNLLVDTIYHHPTAASSAVLTRGQQDWITEAINSPSGRLADLIFDELGWSDDPQAIDVVFKDRATKLLRLSPEPRAYSAAIFARQCNWLFMHDRDWTEAHILAIIENEDDEKSVSDAALSGFLQQSSFLPNDLFLAVKPLLISLLKERKSSPRRHENLLEIVLSGWFRKQPEGGRLITSIDLREALLTTSEEQRLHTLHVVANWSEESEECAEQLTEFLGWVWPRQLAARSPAASSALAEIALRAGDRMPEVTVAVLSILESAAEPIDSVPHLHHIEDDRISMFPAEHLALFYALLPKDAQTWPWGMAQIVAKLAAMPSLTNDRRLSELRRRIART
ncbi:hypothetical protein EJV46_18530 [Roseococcus sp. SYP-B2431]|uniref:SIR2 family protein n=1 Tax=Roseococcus sp. SYP-B2431 TaxID=2496640 RepID=UPI00103A1F9F|nr:SIR2 family protein [Roseococcus sp. SYP-B2431]TCH96586.1 hypothetical protein EJV46_18530 [Roseococcus sp. SYP-B2431]